MKKLNALVKEALSSPFLNHAADVAVKKGRKSAIISVNTYPRNRNGGGGYVLPVKKPGNNNLVGFRAIDDNQKRIADAVSTKHDRLKRKRYDQASKFREKATEQRLNNIDAYKR
jgi:hypothetical protein